MHADDLMIWSLWQIGNGPDWRLVYGPRLVSSDNEISKKKSSKSKWSEPALITSLLKFNIAIENDHL